MVMSLSHWLTDVSTYKLYLCSNATDLLLDGLSEKGTSEGDPLAMPMHALALIKHLKDTTNIVQAYYHFINDGTMSPPPARHLDAIPMLLDFGS